MDVDKESRVFVPSEADKLVLGVTEDATWPVDQAGELLDLIDAAQSRVNSIDLTEYPYGSTYHEAVARRRRLQTTIDGIRRVVVENIEISVGGIEDLLQGPDNSL